MTKVIITLKDKELHQSRLAELQAKVMIGIEQLDRGEGIEWNVADVKTEGRALLAAQRVS